MKKIIYNKLIPFKGYVAINLFGIILLAKSMRLRLKTTISEKPLC